MTRTKVIFDTDPGIDDAMALLYLAACTDIDLLGITTVLGNANIEQCTQNALILCEQFDIDAPVYRGAATGLNGIEPEGYPDFVHGRNGLGDVELAPPKTTTESTHASEYLIKEARLHPGELTLLAVGRLTNIALAIQADSGFASQVKEIIFMGGAWQCEGNVTPWAEANIIGDPEAAAVVFASGIPATMVGLDVTTKTRMSLAYLEKTFEGIAQLQNFILGINQCYAGFHKESENADDFPVHDSSAVAFLDNPGLFSTIEGRLSCVLDGEQRGRTTLTAGMGTTHRVCTAVDSEALLEGYRSRIKKKHIKSGR